MTPRTAWRGCAAAGIVAFICSWSFGRIPGMASCGPDHGLGPILAFEFARTPAEVAALFGSEPCRSALVAAQKTGLLLDGLGFIPLYTAFLICAPSATRANRILRWIGIVAALTAAAADEIEGVLLYAILRDLPGSPMLLQALWWPVHIKFALLALITILVDVRVYPLFGHRALSRIPDSIIFAGGYLALICLFSKHALMMQGFLVAWLTLLIVALIASFSPSASAPEPAGPLPDPVRPSA